MLTRAIYILIYQDALKGKGCIASVTAEEPQNIVSGFVAHMLPTK